MARQHSARFLIDRLPADLPSQKNLSPGEGENRRRNAFRLA